MSETSCPFCDPDASRIFHAGRRTSRSVRTASFSTPCAPGLRELQNDRCFFCESRLGTSGAHVDHFIPWARYPSNGIENLVVAHPECNSQKRDFLAASPHVAKWSTRRNAHSDDLHTIAEQAAWESAGEIPLNVARGIYLSLRGDALLWLRGKEFVPAERAAIEAALA